MGIESAINNNNSIYYDHHSHDSFSTAISSPHNNTTYLCIHPHPATMSSVYCCCCCSSSTPSSFLYLAWQTTPTTSIRNKLEWICSAFCCAWSTFVVYLLHTYIDRCLGESEPGSWKGIRLLYKYNDDDGDMKIELGRWWMQIYYRFLLAL